MVVVGETVMAAVTAPVLQTYVPPPEAVSVADAPLQMIPSLFATPEVSVTTMAAVGSGFTVMVVEAVAVQPSALVTVTVYVVVMLGETVIAAVDMPVLQT